MGASRTEPWLALDFRRRGAARRFLGLENGQMRVDAGTNILGQRKAPQTLNDRPRNHGGREIPVWCQQPRSPRLGPFAAAIAAISKLAGNTGADVITPVVQLFLERIFQNLTFFFNH